MGVGWRIVRSHMQGDSAARGSNSVRLSRVPPVNRTAILRGGEQKLGNRRCPLASNRRDSTICSICPMPSPKPKPTDLSAAHGDPAEWVGRYGDGLFRYASGRVVNRELAEDLVQETLLAAFRHRAQFNGESTFGTWLIAILRRKIVDYYRKRGRSPDLDAESLGPTGDPFLANGKWSTSSKKWRATPNDLAEDAEFWSIFHECMSSLPSHLAQAFQLRELGMSSVEDACATVGVTRRNFAVRLHRSRLLLKQCLEKNWFRSERGGTA